MTSNLGVDEEALPSARSLPCRSVPVARADILGIAGRNGRM